MIEKADWSDEKEDEICKEIIKERLPDANFQPGSSEIVKQIEEEYERLIKNL